MGVLPINRSSYVTYQPKVYTSTNIFCVSERQDLSRVYLTCQLVVGSICPIAC